MPTYGETFHTTRRCMYSFIGVAGAAERTTTQLPSTMSVTKNDVDDARDGNSTVPMPSKVLPQPLLLVRIRLAHHQFDTLCGRRDPPDVEAHERSRDRERRRGQRTGRVLGERVPGSTVASSRRSLDPTQ